MNVQNYKLNEGLQIHGKNHETPATDENVKQLHL